jgi:hypothetical protein
MLADLLGLPQHQCRRVGLHDRQDVPVLAPFEQRARTGTSHICTGMTMSHTAPAWPDPQTDRQRHRQTETQRHRGATNLGDGGTTWSTSLPRRLKMCATRELPEEATKLPCGSHLYWIGPAPWCRASTEKIMSMVARGAARDGGQAPNMRCRRSRKIWTVSRTSEDLIRAASVSLIMYLRTNTVLRPEEALNLVFVFWPLNPRVLNSQWASTSKMQALCDGCS